MNPKALADLIGRAQRQDPAAFDTLVDHFGGRVYGFLFRLSGSRDAAEDLSQEVFLRVVRTIRHYQHDGRFEAWLFRIAANLVRDRVRRAQRAPGRALSAQGGNHDGGGLDGLARTDERPEQRLMLGEDVDRLRAALEHVPAAEREVLMLRHFSDLSFREIAEAMGTPLGTALARAHRALGRLRELLGDEALPAALATRSAGPVEGGSTRHDGPGGRGEP